MSPPEKKNKKPKAYKQPKITKANPKFQITSYRRKKIGNTNAYKTLGSEQDDATENTEAFRCEDGC